MENVTIGAMVREARTAKGLTQEELAEKVEIGVTYLSDIERGKKYPSLSLFVKLTEVLEVSADYLLRGKLDSGKPHIFHELDALMEVLSPGERQGAVEIVKAYVKALGK